MTEPSASEKVSVPLSRPVLAHGEQITTLHLREPCGQDLVKSGLPYRLGSEDGSITVDSPAMSRLISELAGVPPSTIGRLPAKDWQAAMVVVMGFFGDTVPAS